MNVLGMEIPQEVADAIAARAKTQELFKEFIEELKWRWKLYVKDKDVLRVVEFRRKENPGCRIAFTIEYDAELSLEIGYSGRTKDGVEKIALGIPATYDKMELVHSKLSWHIRETYGVAFEQYYPVFYWDDNTIEFSFTPGSQLPQLISILKEIAPNSELQTVGENRIRFKIL